MPFITVQLIERFLIDRRADERHAPSLWHLSAHCSELEFSGLSGDLVELLTLHAPDVAAIRRGLSLVLLGREDVSVNANVHDAVVDGPLFLGIVLPGGGGLDNTGSGERLSLGIDGDELLKHELVDVPGAELLLSSLKVLAGGNNIGVHTKVGHGERRGLIRILHGVRSVLVLELSLSVLDVLLGGNDISVNTEAGDSVALGPLLLHSLGSGGGSHEMATVGEEGLSKLLLVELDKLGVPLAEKLLSISQVLLGGHDVRVEAEVRNGVVDGVAGLGVHALNVKDVLLYGLLIFDVLLRGNNVVVEAEVRHEIFLRPALSLGLGDGSSGNEEILVGEKRLSLEHDGISSEEEGRDGESDSLHFVFKI